ncbi:MAG TPA: hypothetical protein VNY84_04155 [Acidimicrobiales bacterium]|nr:hypothetical protein [Acidimicrobiales bacterium]
MAVAVLAGAGIATKAVFFAGTGAPPVCRASAGTAAFSLDLEQAANATTVAAVGKRMSMPDHAVTVALAATLQESRLHNLAHGDLDSLGIFQQRPSQGWGTPARIMTPYLAAGAFYTRLAGVEGWQTLSVTAAAQAVQRSAAPNAYAQWESEARVLAQALTGEVSAGLTCRFDAAQAVPDATLAQAMTQELGPPALGTSVTAARGWTVASWLVGHAQRFHLTSVAFGGQRWTPSGAWDQAASAGSQVEIGPSTS